MKRGTFRKPTIEEVRLKQAAKRAKLKSKPKPKKAVKKSVRGKNKPKKARSKTLAQLKKELDRVFSIYIRQKYADSSGMVACYTCGKVMHWKQIQNGHFVSRGYLATRWDENNCRPQCVGDNIFGNGKPLDFEERLKKDLGNDFVEKMKAKRHEIWKLDRHWYNEKIAHYNSLIE